MNRNFRLCPPDSISVELYDRSTDTCGNGTARYLLLWSNDLTGEHRKTGNYNTLNRVQVGSGDKFSPAAELLCMDLFPGAEFALAPDSYVETRGGANFQLIRNHAAESVPVIFRAVKSGEFAGTIVAFFPTLAGTNEPGTCSIYSHIGQHGSAFKECYKTTRAATPAEYAALKAELESPGPGQYKLKPVARWLPRFDEIRLEESRVRDTRIAWNSAKKESK